MPKGKGKKKKGGAGKAKGKAKGKGGGKKAAVAAEREELLRVCRRFLTVYQHRCAATSSIASPQICRDCRAALENEKPLSKFVLEPALQPTNPPLAASLPTPVAPQDSSSDKEASLVPPSRATPSILLRPLAEAWVEVKYSCVRVLHVWHLQLTDENIVALALFFESALGVNLKVLELMDAKLSPWAIDRLSRSLRCSQLAVLKLDYNVMPQPQLARLCACVQELPTLQSLGLSYCQMGPSCGEVLGVMAAMTTIKELYLRGNALECEGAVELLRPVVSLCESTGQVQPPSLAKLLLQDNAIDSYGTGGMFAPVICMRVFRRWLLSSPVIEEVNLEGNLIGDGGAREVLEALQGRKEAGHPPIRMAVTNRLSPDIFSGIAELGSPAKKKKGKKKGKGKKKK